MIGEVYNVASGRSYSTVEVAQTITHAMKVNPEISFSGRGRAGDPDRWLANVEKIRRLGFEPQGMLSQGIQETVNWYKENILA